MNRWLIIASLLVASVAGKGIRIAARDVPDPEFGQCRYAGDPHLTPFPPAPGQVSDTYWCQRSGWEVLLDNPWINIFVFIGPRPFVILNYIITFKRGTAAPCVLISGTGSTTCPSSSGISSVVSTSGTSWNHLYPLAQNLNVQITQRTWGGFTLYDFVIRQTFDLIQQSEGVCVEHDCPLERVRGNPPPVVTKVCEIYVAAAVRRLLGKIDDNTIKFATLTCINDLALTFDPQFAQTTVAQLIHASVGQINADNQQDLLIKAEENIKEALAEADPAAAEVIKAEDTCVEEKRCFGNVEK